MIRVGLTEVCIPNAVLERRLFACCDSRDSAVGVVGPMRDPRLCIIINAIYRRIHFDRLLVPIESVSDVQTRIGKSAGTVPAASVALIPGALSRYSTLSLPPNGSVISIHLFVPDWPVEKLVVPYGVCRELMKFVPSAAYVNID